MYSVDIRIRMYINMNTNTTINKPMILAFVGTLVIILVLIASPSIASNANIVINMNTHA